MNIDIESYLSHEEIKEIVREEVKIRAKSALAKEEDIKRIVSNASYDIVWKMIDDVYDLDLKQVLKCRVKSVIEDLTGFDLFKKPDAWSRETNSAYDHLKKCIDDNKNVISRIVSSSVESQTIEALKGGIGEYIIEAIQEIYKADK